MQIRVFNCGSMRPWFPPVQTGVTCLLVASNQGPVLIDTGFGVGDCLRPGRLMRCFMAAMRSTRNLAETAVHQVQQVGYAPNDVRHIIMTHLHIDHAGGLADFPHAVVHVYQPEHDHVMQGHAGWEYVRAHWAHQPRWQPHQLQGEQWYGFPAMRLEHFEPEMWLIPLVGHSPGHSGVAIRTEQGWIVHAGDAVPYNMAVNDVPDWLARRLIGPHVPRIRSLIQDHDDIQVIGSHMAPAFYARVIGW